MTVTLVRDDCPRALRALPTGAFRACITSPPYWEIVDYLPADHPDKALELGHEETCALYVAALAAVFHEVRRTLADDGTLWLNLGDKYPVKPGGKIAGGSARCGVDANRRRLRLGTAARRLSAGRADRPPKSLLMLPARVAMALQDDGWILRAEIIWRKLRFTPHPVDDRPTVAHEPVYLFAKSDRYHYAKAAVPERGTVWDIAPGSDGEHAAPMPPGLARRCVLLGTAPGDHVLDPFGGSGTVGAVAEQEGRHATLIDIDERAIAHARMRTAQRGLFALAAGGGS